MGHYIENTGDAALKLLEMFLAPTFEDVSLAQRMALTPPRWSSNISTSVTP
jgi:oxalate decarboxylase